jgi:ParB family chromosome partitioning protein
MSKRKNKGLGIGALLGNIDPNIESQEERKEVVSDLSNKIAMIPLINIEVNPFQPRVDFDQDALEELSGSIQVHGLIQPITVRHLGGGKFQLISGERRLRASKIANLTEVPAFVRVANDQEMLEMALIENIQRQDLNAIEVAITYQRLMEECRLTHQELSDRMSKGRATITNYVGLLKLPPVIQSGIKDSEISMGHARTLISIQDIAVQMSLFKEIVDKKLSVRQAEELAKRYKDGIKPKKRQLTLDLPPAHQDLQTRLTSFLETKVSLKRNQDGKGHIQINFTSDEDLNRILDILEQE